MSDVGNNTAIAERPARPVDLVRAALERMKPQMELALPRHLTADRLLRVAMTAVQSTPKLLDCDRTSLYRSIMVCAQLGLEPDGVLGQAYLVPFGKTVQFIPGYKGLISLARNSGEVVSIAAHEVRDNDSFEFDFASGEAPKHTFELRQPRGDVIAFYAVARFKDGSFHWDLMTKEEVDRIRDGSQGYISAKKYNKLSDAPWEQHYVEMGKKTIIRRIAKYLPMNVQKAAAIADAYDTGKHVTMDNHGELVIEGDVVETEEEAETKTTKLDRFEQKHSSSEATSSDTQTDVDPAEGGGDTGQAADAADSADKPAPADPAERDEAFWKQDALTITAATDKSFIEQIEQRCQEARLPVEVESLRDGSGARIDALSKTDKAKVLGMLVDRERALKVTSTGK